MKSIKFGSIAIVASTAILSFFKVIGIAKYSWLVCFSPFITVLALAVLIFIGLNALIAISDRLEKKQNDYNKYQ